jgi:cytochrome c-type biogenesis protein CcmF
VGRNRRRYGGYIVHVGMVVLFVAFAGMAFKTETQATLRPGESAALRSPFGHTWTFTHLGVSQYDALNRLVTAGTIELARDGERVGILKSEKRQHVDGLGRPTFEPSTEVGIRSDLREDIYVVMAGVVGGTEQTVYRFTINPLVWWVWYGGYILVFGGLIVMWPGGGSPAVRRTEAGYAVKLVAKA